jgi:hypothetical protein
MNQTYQISHNRLGKACMIRELRYQIGRPQAALYGQNILRIRPIFHFAVLHCPNVTLNCARLIRRSLVYSRKCCIGDYENQTQYFDRCQIEALSFLVSCAETLGRFFPRVPHNTLEPYRIFFMVCTGERLLIRRMRRQLDCYQNR